MMKQPQTGWDLVSILIVLGFGSVIVIYGGLMLINQIVSNKETRVRITNNLGERFFGFLERELKENDTMVESFEINKSTPISQLTDIKSFHYIEDRLFNPNDYYFIKLGEGRYMVYRGNVPPLTTESNEVLNLLKYDPSNGTVSEGYHARLISVVD